MRTSLNLMVFSFRILITLLLASAVNAGSNIASNPSPDGSCGGAPEFTCTGSGYGKCCSKYGFCGNISSYCLTSHGCQQSYGICVNLFPNNTASTDGQCGGSITCAGGLWDGACCSASGFCGYTDSYCQLSNGCQHGLGTCRQASPDGTCGGITDNICTGSNYGICCSNAGFCGSGPEYCGLTCQGQVGPCLSPSVDGSCGWDRGFTCLGSSFGPCCSASSWCGNDTSHCSVARGCNQGGIANPYLGNCTLP